MTTITLTDDDALVLFDLLEREINERKTRHMLAVIDHPAEFWALNGLLCDLQEQLVAPFKSDYRELLAAARERVLDVNDPERTYVVGEG